MDEQVRFSGYDGLCAAHQRTALDFAVQRGDAAIIQVLRNAG